MNTKRLAIGFTTLLTALPLLASNATKISLAPRHSTVQGVVARVPLDTKQNAAPVLSVWIGNDGPYRFALDTSVKYSMILDTSLARGSDPVARLDRVFLSNAEFDGVDAKIENVRGTRGVDGIVGFGLFANVVAALDLGNGELRISKGALPRTHPDVQGLRLFDGAPGMVVKAGDRYTYAEVNTGGSQTAVPSVGSEFLSTKVITFDRAHSRVAVQAQ